MKINKIRVLSLIAYFSMGMAMAGCQESPGESVVVNKDMDNLIEEAEKEDDEGFDVEEDAGKYNTYKTEITNEALGVHVSVDAKVDIPQTDKLSMYRVEQKPISQEMIDRIRKELMGDETLYKGEQLYGKLKSEIEKEIAYIRENIAKMDSGEISFPTEEDYKQLKAEYQRYIDEYEKQYLAAPEEHKVDEIFDGKIRSTEELYNADKSNEFWKWVYDCNPKGDAYYGVSNGEDGYCKVLYAHTSPNWGNEIRYRKCAYGYERLIAQATGIEKGRRCLGRKADKEQIKSVDWGSDGFNPVILEESTTITVDEAIEVADEFLKNVGLEEFKCYKGDIYTELIEMEACCDIEGNIFRTYYILTYMRNVNGVFVSPNDSPKVLDTEYIAQWPVEEMEIRVNDEGIVGFDYIAPLTVTEVLVDNVHMKPYEEIRKTFEEMVAIKHATQNENEEVKITVNRVALEYTRICEEDSLTNGLLVPVWEFHGKSTLYFVGNPWSTNDVMTINAIDGTVIDRSLGY